jgi:hypothetical protein
MNNGKDLGDSACVSLAVSAPRSAAVAPRLDAILTCTEFYRKAIPAFKYTRRAFLY